MTRIGQTSRPLFVAAALAAGCGIANAQSNVTLYGIVATDVVYATHVYKNGRPDAVTYLDNSAQTASRLGFRGSEDLGGGLAAIFQLESGINPDAGQANGGSTFWNRGAFVGLKSPYGNVTLGRQWNLNDDVMGNYFVFGGYAAFRYTEFDYLSDLINNSVKYVSPTIGGFQFEALGALAETGGTRTWEVAGTYAIGPFSASVTYHDGQNRNIKKDDKLTSAGASYKLDPITLRAGYSSSKFDASGFKKASSDDVGVDLSIGASILSADYVTRDQKGTRNDSHFVRLRGMYFLSKRTSLIANVVLLKNTGTAAEHFYGDGAAGKGQNLYTAGLSHQF